MLFDDGILKIYSLENIAQPGEKPKQKLKYKSSHYFGFETVGINRYYVAKQANVQVSDIIHVWLDRTIRVTDICILEDGLQYKCAQVQHVEEDGLRITKITLERLGESYELF